MTSMIDRFADRPTAQRITASAILLIVGLFLVGLTVGFAIASAEKGHLPTSHPWVVLLPILSLPLGVAALWSSYRLATPPRSASRFEKRYWKMIMVVMALGVPIGMALSLPYQSRRGIEVLNPVSNAPLSPALAIGMTLGLLVLLVAAVVVYHRTIDQHEERAYLWGSQFAYYLLTLAVPAWWLLQRGGLLPALDVLAALGLVVASFVIQAAVWAWFKFR